MDIDKNKKRDEVKIKNDTKKMPEISRPKAVEVEKTKENQDPSEFSHKVHKEETYEPNIPKGPKSETYE